MPMRATTVRFSEDLWRLLEREAEREGVSAAQFIRDASVMRAAYAMGRRGEAAYEALAQLGAGNGNGHGNGNGGGNRGVQIIRQPVYVQGPSVLPQGAVIPGPAPINTRTQEVEIFGPCRTDGAGRTICHTPIR